MSLRKAINDHCKWCCYDPKSGLGNWRQQVTACAISRCSWWPYRPTSKARLVQEEAKLAPEQTVERP